MFDHTLLNRRCSKGCRLKRQESENIPVVPEEALATGSNFLKPESIQQKDGSTIRLKLGQRINFTIQGSHTESTYNNKKIYNVPVTSKETGDGAFPLNKTNMGYLAEKLSKNSDSWKNHSFDGVVLQQKNPQTNAPVLSWTIDKDTIK